MGKWLREISVTADGKSFPYQGYEIHFDVSFDDTEDPDQSTVKIYNLTPETEDAIEVGGDFTLTAGYQGDAGVLLEGLITDVHGEVDGTERVCTIEAVDSSEECLNKQVTETFDEGTKASEVLQYVIGEAGLSRGIIDLEDDVEYKRGYHVDGKVREIIKDVAINDCQSKCLVVHGDVHAIPWADAIEESGIVLSEQTGLIGTPTRVSGDHTARTWEVKSLLEHRIRAGMVITVNSQTANGAFTVKKGTHKSDRGEHITTLEVIDFSGGKAGGAPYSGGGSKDYIEPIPPPPTSWEELFGDIDGPGGGGGAR